MSEENDGEIHISSTDASGGAKPGVMRYVLVISLLAAILILSIVWINGALYADDSSDAYADEYAIPAEMSDAGAGDSEAFGPMPGDEVSVDSAAEAPAAEEPAVAAE